MTIFDPRLDLSRQQERLFELLLTGKVVSVDAAFDALYANRKTWPEPHVIRVMMHYIRRKLAPFGVSIQTFKGCGYRLTPESRDILDRVMAKEPANA